MALTPTTDIGADLGKVLLLRRPQSAGFTVGDFFTALRRLGIRDTDELSSIEYGVGQMGNGCISADVDEHGRLEIREGTGR